MRFQLLAVLGALASTAYAGVKFTAPAAGASFAAGSTITVKFESSGEAPALAALSSYQLFLCAGGNTDGTYDQLSTLVTTGDFSTGDSATFTVAASIGGTGTNAYFLKMISVATAGGTVQDFSSRFTLTGMTGTFSAVVKTALTSISGTDGPDEVNDATDSTATTASAAEAGAFTIPYYLQTGLIKYAPMQPIPPTKITKKTATPLFPTSAYTLATTYLSPASITLTVTDSQTFSVSSMENTVAAASQPTGDMAKFLARWKD